MSSKIAVVIGLVATFSLIFVVAISVGYGSNNYLFQDGSTPLTDAWDIDGNYILEFPQESWFHLQYSPGATNKHIASIPFGIHHQDRRYLTLHVSVDIPPGDGKTLSVIIGDGTNFLTVVITGDVDTSGVDSSTPFDLDVSEETLSLEYTQTAGGSSTAGCVMLHWYYKENE